MISYIISKNIIFYNLKFKKISAAYYSRYNHIKSYKNLNRLSEKIEPYSFRITKKERETIVSCVTVPSGNILIRQYGQPKVVGNCPHRTLDMGWSRFIGMILDEYDGVNHITVPSPIFKPYIIKVNTDVLNYRTGAGVNYPIAGKIKRNERYTIVAEKDGWGKLKSGAGWINLKYTERV